MCRPQALLPATCAETLGLISYAGQNFQCLPAPDSSAYGRPSLTGRCWMAGWLRYWQLRCCNWLSACVNLLSSSWYQDCTTASPNMLKRMRSRCSRRIEPVHRSRRQFRSWHCQRFSGWPASRHAPAYRPLIVVNNLQRLGVRRACQFAFANVPANWLKPLAPACCNRKKSIAIVQSRVDL